MNNEEKELLKRNMLFFQLKQKKDLEYDPVLLDHSEKVFEKIETLISKEKIRDIMSVEAIYCYCMEKMKHESGNLNDYTREIVDFIN